MAVRPLQEHAPARSSHTRRFSSERQPHVDDNQRLSEDGVHVAPTQRSPTMSSGSTSFLVRTWR